MRVLFAAWKQSGLHEFYWCIGCAVTLKLGIFLSVLKLKCLVFMWSMQCVRLILFVDVCSINITVVYLFAGVHTFDGFEWNDIIGLEEQVSVPSCAPLVLDVELDSYVLPFQRWSDRKWFVSDVCFLLVNKLYETCLVDWYVWKITASVQIVGLRHMFRKQKWI